MFWDLLALLVLQTASEHLADGPWESYRWPKAALLAQDFLS